MIPHNLPRWIFASICNHFENARGNIPMFIEGQTVNTPVSYPEYFELRIDGPHFKAHSKNEYTVTSDINILCSAIIDSDSHRIQRLAGSIVSFCTTIGIFRYGNGSDDDESQIDCMQPDEDIKVLHFGQIQTAVPLLQAAVHVKYSANLLFP